MAMALPTYDELLTQYGVENFEMKQRFEEKHITKLSLKISRWEIIAKTLQIPTPEIERIKHNGDEAVQTCGMLESWKQRCGSRATYEVLTRELLQIDRTDLAEEVVKLCQSMKDVHHTPTAISDHTGPSVMGTDPSLATFPLQAMSSGETYVFASSATGTSAHPAKEIKQALQHLEEEFFQLVSYVEKTLNKYEIELDTITGRFRMLPQPVKRIHDTDESYKKTRKRILRSSTIKDLFDNLTDLKYWNCMAPDTLAYILKDVKIDDIHQKVDKYRDQLKTFKTKTKLRDLMKCSFDVPDFCPELVMKAIHWEDKSILQVENEVKGILRRTAYSPDLILGLKQVEKGCIKLTFALVGFAVSIQDLSVDAGATGIISIKLEENTIYKETELKDKATGCSELVSKNLWFKTGTIDYGVHGGRDVLIISADPPPHQPEAVARRPGQLTEEDKQKLLSQGVTSDCQSEMDIVRARYRLDKRCEVVGVVSGHSLTREEVSRRITHFLNTTKNDGGLLWYIGAGRRDTGDWCFEDDFITFRDIAQLYLQSKLRGRVLTIISDCSYSGCWARDCMEFLDEQGVQPCGHKAREKGIIIKLSASCQLNERSTEYRYLVSGVFNDKNTGMMGFLESKQLLKTQTTCGIESSHLRCNSKIITDPCTLKSDSTWKQLFDY